MIFHTSWVLPMSFCQFRQFLELDDAAALLFIFVIAFAYLRNQLYGKDPYDHVWFEKPQAGLDKSVEEDHALRDISKRLQRTVSTAGKLQYGLT